MTKKLNRIIGRTILVLLLTGTTVLVVSAVRAKDDKTCRRVEIVIGTSVQKGFVDQKDVLAVIRKSVKANPVGTVVSRFKLRSIEQSLVQNLWIKSAQMYFDNNEVLHVLVEQRIPVARIIDLSGAAYYIDSTGFKLPLSNSDHADVPVFTGIPGNAFAKNGLAGIRQTVRNLAMYIISDSFWLAQSAQIDMPESGQFKMYPSFGHHVIELGDASNPADKLERLKLFYQKVLVVKGFDHYPRISVAYSNQVVAVRGDSAAAAVDAGKALQVFDQLVNNNRKASDVESIQEEDRRRNNAGAETNTPGKPPEASLNTTPNSKPSQNESSTPTPKAVMQSKNNNN